MAIILELVVTATSRHWIGQDNDVIYDDYLVYMVALPSLAVIELNVARDNNNNLAFKVFALNA